MEISDCRFRKRLIYFPENKLCVYFLSERNPIMADKTHKWPDNAKGKYYVDEQCIDCALCRETAPDFFGRNDDGSYSLVVKQPASPAEIEICEEAMRDCPVEAIGNDGEN